jgi:hypothetical protein
MICVRLGATCAPTVRLTERVVAAPPPLGVRVTVPKYVPALRPAMLAETVIGPGVVPVVGVTVSQFPPVVVVAAAAKLTGAAEFGTVTWTVAAAGFELPTVPENVTLAGLVVKVGPAATVRVTGIVRVPFAFAAPWP